MPEAYQPLFHIQGAKGARYGVREAMLEDSQREKYAQAYGVAQAGGMSGDDAHEFAMDQSTREAAI